MYPNILRKVIEDFAKLPGIGEKTAERLALHLVTQSDNEDVIEFSRHLSTLKSEIKFCKTCHMITDKDVCDICSNQDRDHEILMILADAKDVFAMEKIKSFNGVYHILGGLIDFSRGVTDKDLFILDLFDKVKNVKEMIIATNSTVEGEMTAKYIQTVFKDQNIEITRLAYGLPVGTELKYADEQTLSKAVENRRKF